MENEVKTILKTLGDDPDREGLKDTPKRVSEMMKYLTSGYTSDIDSVINGAYFAEPYQGVVMLKDVEFFSLCEHHLLPFWGRVHIGYIPNAKIIGISKIARIIEVFARRLQIQERLTEQIAACIEEQLRPKGVGVIIEASHCCMMMRGVEQSQSKLITHVFKGEFQVNKEKRDEFLKTI